MSLLHGALERWLPWTAAAFAATISHLLIDQHIGLYGASSEEMSAMQAMNILRHAVLAGFWLAAAGAASRNADARRALMWLVVVDAAVLNGIVAFAVAPPPSAAFPYQDIAHGAALIFGLIASLALARSLVEVPSPTGRAWRTGIVAVIAGNQAAGLWFHSAQGMFG